MTRNVLYPRIDTSTTITASSAAAGSETERSHLNIWERSCRSRSISGKPLSQGREFEAIAEGMYLAVQSGYSPYGAS